MAKEAFILTLRGIDWMDSSSGEVSNFEAHLFDVLGDIQEGSPVDYNYYKKELDYAVDRGYVVRDTRSTREVLSNIARYDTSLGKILRVYHDIGLQKTVRDEDLQEALFNAFERSNIATSRMTSSDRPSSSLLKALRSSSSSEKIEALDTWVSKLHREGLLWSRSKNVPDQISADVATILDRFRDE